MGIGKGQQIAAMQIEQKQKKNCRCKGGFALRLKDKSDLFQDRIPTSYENLILHDNRRYRVQCLNRNKARNNFQKPNLHNRRL